MAPSSEVGSIAAPAATATPFIKSRRVILRLIPNSRSLELRITGPRVSFRADRLLQIKIQDLRLRLETTSSCHLLSLRPALHPGIRFCCGCHRKKVYSLNHHSDKEKKQSCRLDRRERRRRPPTRSNLREPRLETVHFSLL